MAKQSIPQASYPVNNVRLLPDQVKGDAPFVKETFDKGTEDGKTYINSTLIPALNGNTGANMIGLSNLNLASNNVADGIEEVRVIAVQAQAGEILPNSTTNEQLGIDVKVGSLSALNTTDKTTVTNAINELEGEIDTLQTDVSSLSTSVTTNATSLEILRKFNVTTGSNVALAVDTFGTFDLTKTGNILNILPNVTNTGAMTINADGQGAKAIKKFNVDTDAYVDIEASDIKKNTPISLSWDLTNNFFVYAPKGKDLLKGLKNTFVTNNTKSASTMTLRTTINGSGWVFVAARNNALSDFFAVEIDGVFKIGSSTTGFVAANTQSMPIFLRFESSFKLYSTSNRIAVIYTLSNDLSKYSALLHYGLNTGTAPTTNIVNVSGKGWFKGVTGSAGGEYSSVPVKITIDGVVQFSGNSVQLGNCDLLTRFENSLQIQMDTVAALDFLYTLD